MGSVTVVEIILYKGYYMTFRSNSILESVSSWLPEFSISTAVLIKLIESI